MCGADRAAKEAAIARFLHDHPQAADAGQGHPALHGCEAVRWPRIPGCPAGIPLLLRALLDASAADEARQVLANCLFDDITRMSAAMPNALPFLLRLARDPDVPNRSGLLRLLVTVAEYAEPVDNRGEAMVRWFGSDEERPERARCRAVFEAESGAVATLPDGLVAPADHATLRRVAGLL